MILIVWLLGWLCLPHLLLLNKRPTATLAWIWAILLFPVIGPGFYLMIGSERVKRQRMKRRKHFRTKGHRLMAGKDAAKSWKDLSKKAPVEPAEHAFLQGLATMTQLPGATIRNSQILRKAAPFYDALEKDIRKAEHSVEIVTYIWRDDEVGRRFLDLLVAAAQRGVTVRLLIDEIGSLWLRGTYFAPLIRAGGQFSWCHTLSPLRSRYSFNLRNHRKLQIIDGKISYVGGMNFGREYLGLDPTDGDWADVQIRIEGQAAKVFREVYAEDWYFATGKDDIREHPGSAPEPEEATLVQVLRGGPDEDDHPMLRIYLALVAAAKTRLWIATGYFVPGEIMQTALQVAAARGVDVQILISSKSEHPLLVKAGRSYYDALLRQGVKLFEYSKGIEHSKYLIIDSDWLSVGSTNLDERSLRLNFELNLLCRSTKANQELSRIFRHTISEAKQIERLAFDKRPYHEKLIESALRPLSPLF
ncbi:MAG TPA: cardiolipin synthase [Candidatus Methylacidiphilales bacterium]